MNIINFDFALWVVQCGVAKNLYFKAEYWIPSYWFIKLVSLVREPVELGTVQGPVIADYSSGL